eukprot:7072916-Lingulodinium_polyedra.AAC.1
MHFLQKNPDKGHGRNEFVKAMCMHLRDDIAEGSTKAVPKDIGKKCIARHTAAWARASLEEKQAFEHTARLQAGAKKAEIQKEVEALRSSRDQLLKQ